MKKLIIMLSMLLLLTACANNTNESTTEQKQAVSTETEENQTVSDAEEAKEDSKEELTSFLEYDTLVVEINIKDLKADVKTDNANKRVIIFKDESGEKKYKSIYIKKEERLKIISLDDEGQIYNEII
ncbi:hypothetical protein [Bacillus sp. SD088]|uniref:hypothetical protein n=1 Tax=Bacillus sp. SD088 TaxID=2782012 RepID=UPI001A97C767|nr:hypothetical protein [Bacillus sp. SD088]MBO0992562.1 hypothetical protein [Bacillus sp. SD088]